MSLTFDLARQMRFRAVANGKQPAVSSWPRSVSLPWARTVTPMHIPVILDNVQQICLWHHPGKRVKASEEGKAGSRMKLTSVRYAALPNQSRIFCLPTNEDTEKLDADAISEQMQYCAGRAESAVMNALERSADVRVKRWNRQRKPQAEGNRSSMRKMIPADERTASTRAIRPAGNGADVRPPQVGLIDDDRRTQALSAVCAGADRAAAASVNLPEIAAAQKMW